MKLYSPEKYFVNRDTLDEFIDIIKNTDKQVVIEAIRNLVFEQRLFFKGFLLARIVISLKEYKDDVYNILNMIITKPGNIVYIVGIYRTYKCVNFMQQKREGISNQFSKSIAKIMNSFTYDEFLTAKNMKAFGTTFKDVVKISHVIPKNKDLEYLFHLMATGMF